MKNKPTHQRSIRWFNDNGPLHMAYRLVHQLIDWCKIGAPSTSTFPNLPINFSTNSTAIFSINWPQLIPSRLQSQPLLHFYRYRTPLINLLPSNCTYQLWPFSYCKCFNIVNFLIPIFHSFIFRERQKISHPSNLELNPSFIFNCWRFHNCYRKHNNEILSSLQGHFLVFYTITIE